jgi:hypothetical protein
MTAAISDRIALGVLYYVGRMSAQSWRGALHDAGACCSGKNPRHTGLLAMERPPHTTPVLMLQCILDFTLLHFGFLDMPPSAVAAAAAFWVREILEITVPMAHEASSSSSDDAPASRVLRSSSRQVALSLPACDVSVEAATGGASCITAAHCGAPRSLFTPPLCGAIAATAPSVLSTTLARRSTRHQRSASLHDMPEHCCDVYGLAPPHELHVWVS